MGRLSEGCRVKVDPLNVGLPVGDEEKVGDEVRLHVALEGDQLTGVGVCVGVPVGVHSKECGGVGVAALPVVEMDAVRVELKVEVQDE